MAGTPVGQTLHGHRSEDRRQHAPVARLDVAVDDPGVIGHRLEPWLRRSPHRQMILQHAPQQLPAAGIEFGLQLAVRQTRRLPTIEPGQQLIETSSGRVEAGRDPAGPHRQDGLPQPRRNVVNVPSSSNGLARFAIHGITTPISICTRIQIGNQQHTRNGGHPARVRRSAHHQRRPNELTPTEPHPLDFVTAMS